MIGELASALPEEGGYYAWVRRALGNCWGFQEAWLSLVGQRLRHGHLSHAVRRLPGAPVSLVRRGPSRSAGRRMVVVALRGTEHRRHKGRCDDFPLAVRAALRAVRHHRGPGAVQVRSAGARGDSRATTSHVDIIGGLLVAMWNYMGWDNASTIAAEVDQPQRTYPRAMMAAVAAGGHHLHSSGCGDVADARLSPSAWETGSWADIAGMLGGPLLRIGLVAGRHDERLRHVQRPGDELLTPALRDGPGRYAAQDFRQSDAAQRRRRGSRFWCSPPDGRCVWAWASSGWSPSTSSSTAEACSSSSWRWSYCASPSQALPRPFKVPGGMFGVVLVGLLPTLLLIFSIIHGEHEQVLGMSGFIFGALLVAGGFVAYGIDVRLRPAHRLKPRAEVSDK